MIAMSMLSWGVGLESKENKDREKKKKGSSKGKGSKTKGKSKGRSKVMKEKTKLKYSKEKEKEKDLNSEEEEKETTAAGPFTSSPTNGCSSPLAVSASADDSLLLPLVPPWYTHSHPSLQSFSTVQNDLSSPPDSPR